MHHVGGTIGRSYLLVCDTHQSCVRTYLQISKALPRSRWTNALKYIFRNGENATTILSQTWILQIGGPRGLRRRTLRHSIRLYSAKKRSLYVHLRVVLALCIIISTIEGMALQMSTDGPANPAACFPSVGSILFPAASLASRQTSSLFFSYLCTNSLRLRLSRLSSP